MPHAMHPRRDFTSHLSTEVILLYNVKFLVIIICASVSWHSLPNHGSQLFLTQAPHQSHASWATHKRAWCVTMYLMSVFLTSSYTELWPNNFRRATPPRPSFARHTVYAPLSMRPSTGLYINECASCESPFRHQHSCRCSLADARSRPAP